ncbi:Low temperature requirement protein LtrA [Micromonospora citrea]|uniref:Low temperature requirement protein LtrA n=1 Tax=Micromonospora citrea TaxID=47855 RepID=A0A1C6TR45_9ACTN|nr:low temperature requirement protein A [Micromonospora citrea]SCL44101.1 Low temperature requirement protein LtrA [Micromonospora citrea]
MTEKGPTVAAGRIQLVGESSAVSRIELFLDLIFVFGFITVSSLVAADLTVESLLQGVVLLALLWSCWMSYAWLGNAVRVDRGVMPVVVFVLAAAVLIVGVTLQEAFADKPGGLHGPLLLVSCYLIVRCGTLLVATVAVWRDPAVRRRRLQAWWPPLASAPLLLAAGLLPTDAFGDDGQQTREWTRFALVLAAIVVDYVGVRIVGVVWWRVRSVKHWTERFQLIVLVAFGEIIISAGRGQSVGAGTPVTWGVVGGAVLSMLLVGVLWWTYFDIARFAAEDALEHTSGAARARLARDAYAYLHLPMIVGLTLLSLGLKHTFEDLAFELIRSEPPLSVFALYGGVALYLLALIVFERRTMGIWGRGPIVGLVLVLALAPVAAHTPVVVELGLLAAAVVSLVLLDRTVFRLRHRALHRRIEPVTERLSGVTPKELFLDLVFVFAFLQVTQLMTVRTGWRALAEGIALLVLVWWAWCCYAWLGSALRTESAFVRLLLLGAAASILVIAVAVPVIFDDMSGGLPGPVVFVTCYGIARALNIAAFWMLARKDRVFRGQVVRLAVPAVVALVLLYAASVPLPPEDPGRFAALRAGLWVAAVVVDLGSGYLLNARHWPIRSAEHWADRFGLIILVALGGAIVSTGASVSNRAVSAPMIGATVLGLVVVAMLWWVYFDVDATAGQRRLQSLQDGDRSRLALEAYVYTHLAMIIGVVLVALGLRKTVAEIERIDTAAGWSMSHLTLYGGVIVFLVGDKAFWWRIRHRFRRRRLAMIATLLALMVVTTVVSRLAGLAVLAAVLTAFTAAEAVGIRELRDVADDPLVEESSPPHRR